MKKQILILEHVDAKISQLKKAEDLVIPTAGWIYSIRQALGMSMRQLGNRMGITPQSVKEIEEREKSGTITLKVLRQFGQASELKTCLWFYPVRWQSREDNRTTGHGIGKRNCKQNFCLDEAGRPGE